ncbi:unnamed protein product [Schistosoma mattheei]|uniref:Bestrophin homolog n=1 Tax=Schistosoma mattheei TaxID=31246 RepID=A0A183PAX8_9TREM|nr:unnamed protein product [Schistosoma mattheei]
MTVSYGSLIATVKYGSFFRLLFRWRGSLYKLVWPGLLVYCFFYAVVAIAYHSIPDEPEYRNARLLFVQICYIAGRVTNAVPLSFVLAFYVNLVVSRWLQQFLCLPTPDAICVLLSAYLGENPNLNDHKKTENSEERALIFRRTISRYVNLASALCFCSISVGMKQRFPTLDSLVICGLMTEQELEIYSNLEESTSNFFVPLVWAISLITKAHEENMIREERHVDALVNQVVEFWEKLYKLCMYDWVNVPLVYNQQALCSTEVQVTTVVRLAFSNLRHLWRGRDIRLSTKGRVYCTAVRSVLLYGSETWPVRVENIRRLLVFDHSCLRNIARISWDHRVSNAVVRKRVLEVRCVKTSCTNYSVNHIYSGGLFPSGTYSFKKSAFINRCDAEIF